MLYVSPQNIDTKQHIEEHMSLWREKRIPTTSLTKFDKVKLMDVSKSGVPLLLCERGDLVHPIMGSEVLDGMTYIAQAGISPDEKPVYIGTYEKGQNDSPKLLVQRGTRAYELPYSCNDESDEPLLFLGNEEVFVANDESPHVLICGDRVVDMAEDFEALTIEDGKLCYAKIDEGLVTLVKGEKACRLNLRASMLGAVLRINFVTYNGQFLPNDFNKWTICFEAEEKSCFLVGALFTQSENLSWVLRAGGYKIGIECVTPELDYIEVDRRQEVWDATLVWRGKRIDLGDCYSSHYDVAERFAFYGKEPILLLKNVQNKAYRAVIGEDSSPHYDFILKESFCVDNTKRTLSFVARRDKTILRVTKRLPAFRFQAH